ncbi:hypothetical protein [Streptomyces sp. NPDC002746]
MEEIPKDVLFSWVGKIYYGVMFRELTLRSELRDPHSPPIMDAEFLQLFHQHHLLLQNMRGVVNWISGHSPSSFLFFKCQVSKNPSINFDYFDVANLPFIALRIGEVGLVASLQDWGQLENYTEDPLLSLASSMNLHPQQFREVAARAAYAVSRIDLQVPHTPVYGPTAISVLDPGITDFYEGSSIADPDENSYVGLLSLALRQPDEELRNGTSTLSLLHDGQGQPIELPWSVDEWRRVTI